MISPNLSAWEDANSISELLFACQTVDELLFLYSLDSYRLPTLNTRLRIQELIDAAGQCSAGNLHPRSLPSVRDEAIRSLRDDVTAKRLLGVDWRTLVEIAPQGDKATEARNVQLWALSVSRVLGNRYLPELLKDLRIAIETGGRRQLVRSLLRSILVELVSRGYSREWLYSQLQARFFLSHSPPVSDIHTLSLFLEGFDAKKNEYRIVLRAKAQAHVAALINKARIPIRTIQKEHDFVNAEERKFFGEEHCVFLEVEGIEAPDPLAARYNAEQAITQASAALRFFSHESTVELDGQALIYQDEGLQKVPPSAPPPMLRRSDPPRPKVPRQFHQLISLEWDASVSGVSKTRLREALEFHDNATSAGAEENQLLNLWTIIEILTEPPIGQTRLVRILDLLLPVLTRRYFLKLLACLKTDAVRCLEAEAKKGENVPPFPDELEPFVAFVLTEEKAPERQQLFDFVELRNPLLFNRMGSLNHLFQDKNRVKDALQRHKERVHWQLERIYRTRNLIIHEGTTPGYTTRLVENLHDYVDYTLAQIIRRLTMKNGPRSIGEVFFDERLAAETHERFINGIEQVDDSNVVAVALGSDFSRAIIGA